MSFFDLIRYDLAETDVANLALLLHLAQRTEGLFQRSTRVDAVKLERSIRSSFRRRRLISTH